MCLSASGPLRFVQVSLGCALMSFPRACGMRVLSSVLVDDDRVALLEGEGRLEYHTFSGGAFEVWILLDGLTSLDEIAAQVFPGRRDGLVLVTMALQQLDGADLLAGSSARLPAMNRRTAIKAAAAGLPLVVSISAPYAASAVSRWGSRGPGESCGVGLEGCTTGCCCAPNLEAIQGICLDRTYCEGYPAYCI